jgi:1,4-dihydroxy-2-naphthoyl-CoA hydrolase
LDIGRSSFHEIVMPFSYPRTIHFADTDAAGIVFFARYLAICHEAYEEALAAAGVPLATFFSDHGVIVPIAKSECSYLRPLACGEKVRVEVTPRRLSANSFALEFSMWKLPAPGSATGEKRAAVARTEHVCVSSASRERQTLPAALATWVDAG